MNHAEVLSPMGFRRSGEITFDDLTAAHSGLLALYGKRQVPIPADSVLKDHLVEVDKFVRGVADLPMAATEKEQEQEELAIAKKLLTVHRLWESLDRLNCRKTTQITERLQDLATPKLSDPKGEDTWWDYEFETFCASEFTLDNTRVNFVRARARKRNGRRRRLRLGEKKVEFLIRHRWPVECKRPRRRRSVIDNVEKAAVKIQQREKRGMICISLDRVLLGYQRFLDVSNYAGFRQEFRKLREEFARSFGGELVARIRGIPVVVILFHYTHLSYYYEGHEGALPQVWFAMRADGHWFWTDEDDDTEVIRQCLRALEVFELPREDGPTGEEGGSDPSSTSDGASSTRRGKR